MSSNTKGDRKRFIDPVFIQEDDLPPPPRRDHPEKLSAFVDKLQAHPMQWALFGTGYKGAIRKTRLAAEYAIYTEVRNVLNPINDTFTIYMRWTGPKITDDEL